MNLIITAFQALCGDCMLVSLQRGPDATTQHIVIDAGFSQTYHRTLAAAIRRIVSCGDPINLFVLTHTDNDHVSGAIPFLKEFSSSVVNLFWMNYAPQDISADNGGPVSVAQGISLREQLISTGKINSTPILASQHHQFDGLNVFTLSPDADQYERFLTKWKSQEQLVKTRVQTVSHATSDHRLPVEQLAQQPFTPDTSWSNRSSIAFLLTVGAFCGLFTGDAHADVVAASLRGMGYTKQHPVRLNFMKVSHHGSKGNSSDELLDLIDCQHYLISTNGANQHGLPHKEALARIVLATRRRRPNEQVHLYFTYDDRVLRSLFTEFELDQYGICCHYPATLANCISLTYEC